MIIRAGEDEIMADFIARREGPAYQSQSDREPFDAGRRLRSDYGDLGAAAQQLGQFPRGYGSAADHEYGSVLQIQGKGIKRAAHIFNLAKASLIHHFRCSHSRAMMNRIFFPAR